jgi:hypothetical protein
MLMTCIVIGAAAGARGLGRHLRDKVENMAAAVESGRSATSVTSGSVTSASSVSDHEVAGLRSQREARQRRP